MQGKIRTFVWIVVAMVLGVSACSQALPVPIFGFDSTPDLVMTSLVQTLTAAPALTAAAPAFTATQKNTPTNTKTPVPSFTPIPTFTLFPSLTPFPSLTTIGAGTTSGTLTPEGTQEGTGEKFSCKFIETSPSNWTIFKPYTAFNVSWRVRNTGTQIWRPDTVILSYLDGAKIFMNNKKNYTLTDLVKPGDALNLSADMVAPKESGSYISNWGLILTDKTKTIVCPLSVRIIVRK